MSQYEKMDNPNLETYIFPVPYAVAEKVSRALSAYGDKLIKIEIFPIEREGVPAWSLIIRHK